MQLVVLKKIAAAAVELVVPLCCVKQLVASTVMESPHQLARLEKHCFASSIEVPSVHDWTILGLL